MRYKTLADKYRHIEIEFGFRYCKSDIKPRVQKLAREIYRLRKEKVDLIEQRKFDKDRIRELELQIVDLDYKLRG